MSTLEILSLLFATAAIFGGISRRWLKLPITVGTMLLTVAASAGLMLTGRSGWAFGVIHQIDFAALILRGMLPLLLFAGAFLLDLDQLAREKLAVSLLAVVGTVASFLLVAGLMGLAGAHRIPWTECLLFGALISPTDPIAVLEMLRRVGMSKAVQAQLAGESLFNDGVGAVIFLTLLAAAEGNAPTAGQFILKALLESGGGILLGVAAALVTSWLMRRVDAYQVDILFTVALALGGYVLATRWNVSGPLEAVTAGIALRYFNSFEPSEWIAHEQIDRFWELIDEIQNSILFVLLGLGTIAIRIDGITARYGLIAIVLVNVVRLAVVFVLLRAIRLVQRDHRSSALVMSWGGLRGGLSIALALSVPEPLGRSWIVGATYIVVVFSVLIQGGSMNWMIQRLRKKQTAA